MKNKNLLTRILFLTVVVLAFSMAGFAQTKTVTVAPANQQVTPSTAFTFDVNYTSTSNTTTGIGFKMCYDSTKVTFVSRTNVFTTGNQGASDAADVSGGGTTDRCVTNLWLDLGGNWPGVALPIRLYTANFTTTAGFNGSSIVFVNSSCGAGFTCTYPTETLTAPVPYSVSTLLPNPATTQAGANATMTVTINQAAGAGGQIVNLSSNSANVTVPATVTVAAGLTSATFPAHGVNVGAPAATISAQIGATPAVTAVVNVTAATITLNCPTNVSNGGTAPCTVQVTPGQATTVTLGTAGGHTTVPPNVVTNASGAGTFNVTGTSVGGPDTITATLPVALGGAFATDTVTVQAVTLTVSPTTVASGTVGAPISFTVCISAPQGAASPITFTGANVANFIFSPSAPSIPAGQICPTTVSFTATPTAVTGAPMTFTVNAGGLSVPVTVSAVAGITCTLTDAGNGALLTISQAQPAAFPVTVTSSNTAVLTVSSPFNFPAGQTSALIPYTVLTAGTSDIVTTLDATVGGGVCRVVATVNPTPIPAVGGLGLALLAGLLALAGAFFIRKH